MARIRAETIQPFQIDVAQTALDDLIARLDRTRWTDELPGSGWSYGTSLAEVRRLAEYWRHGYDWRSWEARLNAHPQFTTVIDGQRIHFLHVRSPQDAAFPLILTHGWPGSVTEYLRIIEPLTDAGFHLVIPSLPGFGFSGPTSAAGWGTARTARAWAELMRRLGYDRYGAVGNDAGSMVSPELGRIDGEHVSGVHVTQIFAFPSGDPAEFADMSPDDLAALRQLQWFMDHKFSFNQLCSQLPQTLAHALADSPVGLLGWQLVLLGADVMGEQPLDDDFILTNVAIYWLTNTGGSSIRFYYENAKAKAAADGPTTVPIGLATFAGDFGGVRRFAEREHTNIVQWNTYEQPGGHYAAHLETDLLANDIRNFFTQLLGRKATHGLGCD
jgi:pimeloyl-ACP methyl ester carboxylesterase